MGQSPTWRDASVAEPNLENRFSYAMVHNNTLLFLADLLFNLSRRHLAMAAKNHIYRRVGAARFHVVPTVLVGDAKLGNPQFLLAGAADCVILCVDLSITRETEASSGYQPPSRSALA